MTIQYVEPWRKYDCAYGKGELLIWSFKLESGIGRVDVGCCWLLLIADGCYWLLDDCWLRLGYCSLLLVASGCWMVAVCGWDTACRRKSLWIFSGCWCIAAKTILQAKKSDYFQDYDDLRLRQFCRRKSFWILPGYWWFAAKTVLQAKSFEDAMKKFG